MASIIPVPTTRVGDYFVRQRLIGQMQNDQLDLFRLQNQISTGRRLQLPSDDAPAALRAINLQRLLDRKGQVQSNVLANNHFLSAAEAQLDRRLGHIDRAAGEDTLAFREHLSTNEDRQQAIDDIDIALGRTCECRQCEVAGPIFVCRLAIAGTALRLQRGVR